MTKKYLAQLAVRLILPAGLLLSIALRPFGISVIYLLLYLIAPLLSVPDSLRKFKGYSGTYLLITLIISVTLLISHGVWHSALSTRYPYGSMLNNSVIPRDVFFNLGYVSYTNIDTLTALQYVVPELVSSATSLLTFLTVKSVVGSLPPTRGPTKDSQYQQYPLCTRAGKYLALFLIMFSGIMRPSITSGIYFLAFLALATTWSLGRSIEKLLAVVGRCLMSLMAVQTFVLLVYQCTMICNDLYPPDMNFARYFGLTKMVTMAPPDHLFRYQVFEDNQWSSLAAPLVILITYYVLAIESRELLKPKVQTQRISMFRRQRTNSAASLLGTIQSKSRKYTMQRKRNVMDSLQQDSIGSLYLKNDDAWSVSSKPKIFDEIISLIVDLFQVIVRSSYIATTITMMAWSIMYHSWLTFVLLMWANVVWLRSDQRSFMLKTSPILVVYAILLLLAQYIYGMDLLESELPTKIANQNLKQIGLSRTQTEPCVPLLVKSLFTCMFWVTLRQRMQDLRKERQASIVADLAAPLHLTASTAGSGMEGQSEAGRSRLLRGLGEWLRGVCAMYWIYVVVIMLVVIGITGERMTIFRIIYMFLFVAFILMFQISWHWWRRLMYVFWITVIIYSMINLIAIYIYQFDNSSEIIEKYLYINQRLQHDLGLSIYNPADLFVKLLTPTCFLIITIMQVHYFHKDFMAMSFTQTIIPKAGSSRPSQTGATLNQEIPPLPIDGRSTSDGRSETDVDHSLEQDTQKEDKISLKSSFRDRKRYPASGRGTATETSRTFGEWARRWCGTLRVQVRDFSDHLCVYLEIHLFKVVYVALMLLCVLNVCAMHIPIILIIVPALHLVSPSKQRVCVLIISILISVYLMAIMVYQIEYIQHSRFDVNCTIKFITGNMISKTYNNADWIGFAKATKTRPLTQVLKGYIAMIALFTFKSMVEYRQHNLRKLGLSPIIKNNLVFPEVNRKEADIDIPHCLKFLVNFAFYKFGVEITLICLMGVIGSRMDAIAVIYAIWLLVLVSVNRPRLSRVWPYFLFCITALLPLQYVLAVGFIPQLCVWYPWSGDDEQIRQLRSWLFLPHPDSPPHATKLIFDFFLLLFAVCQRAVFRIEQTVGEEYKGGSNSEDIGHDWETEDFVNPVPDFLGYIGSWLDVVKRTIFLGMLWVTLAIMFLTGTNRVNLFSMGYLIGSFIFLWQGTDFYLRPKNAILNWWSWLLRYNVGVVVTKTLLQIPGCMFSAVMQKHACWLVQLLGIGCVDKFAGGNLARFIKMAEVAKSDTCSVPQEDIGLAWDGVCFAFLILQRRFFHSYYFYRVIDESKATTVLASRGAELIEELRLKQMSTQEQEEMQILIKIKVKMEKIKANQKKIQGMTKEPRHHDADEDTTSEPSRCAELVRGESVESRVFHTPVSSSPPSPRPSPPPSPPASSALVTVSLSAYLDGPPWSISSPPNSPPPPPSPPSPSPSPSYPVFSPPPIRRRHTLAASPAPRRHSTPSRRSLVSITEHHSHHTYETDDGVRRAYPRRHKGSRQRFTPKSHVQAIRSGDYYMFDEFDEADLKTKDESSSDEEAPSKELGIGKLLSSVLRTGNVKRAISMRRASAPAVRSPRSPRSRKDSYSEPLSRDSARTRDTGRDGSVPPDDKRFATDIDIIAPEPARETWFDKLARYKETAWAFLSSLLISITRHLMKYSRDYRYVSRTLSMEKKVLKETKGFGIGKREGSQFIWEPRPETIKQRKLAEDVNKFSKGLLVPEVEMGRKLSEISVPEIRILAPSMERGLDVRPASPAVDPPSPSLVDDDDDVTHQESMFSLQTNGSKDVSALDEYEDSMFRQDRSPFVHLAYAFWFAILAHTDIVCYIMVFINQVQSATILSIPLPLMVFLWGTLTIPRPTKTFWVTLIAYTEVIVLVKSMFQFEILPWNQKMIPSNMPFSSPRIIGIERQSNYALYDLLLLLIIFLHRFMLKSLGLWKESLSDVEVHQDAKFEATHEDLHMISEGHSEDVGRKYIQLHRQGPGEDSNNEIKEKKQTRVINTIDVPGPSKSSQSLDEHFEDFDDKEPIITVNTVPENPMNLFPGIISMSVRRYLQPMAHFFHRVLMPGARVTADVYAYMFLCDFFNFLVVIFGFAAFGTHQGDGGVQAYLEENKVPIAFLVMLILQFALIIIDRALYLRKYILGKLLFHYALIIGVHIWMFFVLPYITERRFNALIPPPLWYMVKCVYLLLSAYQIRCGYPRRIIGNFLCKSYRFINMVLFRSFMAVPFVFELRTLMDWIWTDTSMTLMDWLKMEDVFANVYLLKCSRYMESEFPQERGSKKSPTVKYLLGGGVLMFIIAIIWFPLVFFAFGNTVGESNPPTDVTVKIRIGPFLPIFQMSAQSHNIDVYTMQDYTKLGNIYARDRSAQTFLSNYMFNDVAAVTINPNSTLKWEISPPELDRLEKEALSNATLRVKFTYVITHQTNSAQNPPTIEGSREVLLPAFNANGTLNRDREKLTQLLNGTATSDTWLNIPDLFPKFVKVFNKGIAKPTHQLLPRDENGAETEYRDVKMRLENERGSMYWRVHESCENQEELLTVPLHSCEKLVMFTFNDKLFPETLNFISGSGIIGLYTTFVFLASRVLRGFFSGIYTKIMFDDLPNVDRVLQLCLDIYLVREALELALEEDLFAKLVFLYRSPETMIKWSRPKEDTDDQRVLPPPPTP